MHFINGSCSKPVSNATAHCDVEFHVPIVALVVAKKVSLQKVFATCEKGSYEGVIVAGHISNMLRRYCVFKFTCSSQPAIM